MLKSTLLERSMCFYADKVGHFILIYIKLGFDMVAQSQNEIYSIDGYVSIVYYSHMSICEKSRSLAHNYLDRSHLIYKLYVVAQFRLGLQYFTALWATPVRMTRSYCFGCTASKQTLYIPLSSLFYLHV